MAVASTNLDISYSWRSNNRYRSFWWFGFFFVPVRLNHITTNNVAHTHAWKPSGYARFSMKEEMWSPSVADRSGSAFSGHPLLFSAPSNEPKSDAQFIQSWRHTQEYEHNFAIKLLGAHILYPLKVVNMREYPWNIYSIWNINLIDVYEKSVSCYVIGVCIPANWPGSL